MSAVPTYYYCLVVFLCCFLVFVFEWGGEGGRERGREGVSEGRKNGSSRVHMGMEVLDYYFVSFATVMHVLM